jgi:hypothetical protein
MPVLVPPLTVNTTASPPAVRLFPAASFVRRNRVTVSPAAAVPVDSDTVDWLKETAPAGTVIVGMVEVTAAPPIVAYTVEAVPTVTAVKVAAYVPLASSAVAPMVPVLVPPLTVNATVRPPVVKEFPLESLAWSWSVAVPPDVTVPADTDTVDRFNETAPGVTAIVGSVEVTAAPPIVARTVEAVPAVTGVKVAVYVPFPLSVVAPIVPALVPPLKVNATESPPVVRLFPLASLAWSWSVAAPPDTTVPAETDTVDWLNETVPTVTVIVGKGDDTAVPPIVACTVAAVPAVPAVKVAVYVPLALSVVAPTLAPPTVNATVRPPVVKLLPFASLAWSVKVTVFPDATVPAETDTVDWLKEAAPGVTAIVGRVEITAMPPIVACTVVAVPAVPAVKVAVYVPFALSVVAPTVPVLVPPLTVNTTVRPPVV